MKILVTFAVETELNPWRRLRNFERVSELPFLAYQSAVAGTEVRAIVTGMGTSHAKWAMGRALTWIPDVCVSSGLAGSLRSVYRREEILVAKEVMELQGGRTVAGDAKLMDLAEKRGARPIERMLTSESLVMNSEGKARLGRMAEAVEMESCAVLWEAVAQGIPAIAIRAISDAVDQDLPLDFSSTLDRRGNVETSKLLCALARAPHKLPGLIRLGRDSHRAAIRLASFLDAYVKDLALRCVRPRGTAEVTGA